ncbi:MAG TPA: hypothetical protein VHH34_24150 [Pseudonocardiaceae bacterium]|nr:hypothetical protein [Pseudonocardiaceae bacterium]
MTMDPSTVADLGAALAELTDHERTALELRTFKVATHFADVKMPRVAAVFHTLGVLAAEEGDRRSAMSEHARVELEGDEEVGEILPDLPPDPKDD